jgi:short-subunit dehydrogenase
MRNSPHRAQAESKQDFTEISYARIEKTFSVNIVAMIAMAQRSLPHMPRGGAIINVSAPLGSIMRLC